MNVANIKRLYPYVLPYKRFAFLNVFFNILYALFSSLSFVALIPMLEVLFDARARIYQKPVYKGISEANIYFKEYLNYQVTQHAGGDPVQALSYIIALVLLLFFLKNIFNYLAIVFINLLRNGVLKDLRNMMYKKIISLPISYFSEKRKGDVISRITTDINEFQTSYLSILEFIVKEPLTIIFTIVIMCGISLKLTVFVFVFIPVAGLAISRVGKTLKKHSGRVQAEQGFFLSLIEETLSGLRIIKSFNAQGAFIKRFTDSTQRFNNYANNLSYRQNLASPISEFLGILVIGILLWYGGTMVLVDKTLGGSEFVAYMGLAYNILTPAKEISKAAYRLRQGDAAALRVLEVIHAQNPIFDKENAIEKTDFQAAISLKNISFKYDNEYVLKDFSLEIPKGKTVALVGQSGSGKSTIANLIARFYDVNEGSITFDGTDIRDLKIQSLRDLIGIVSQDSILFNDTITNNLLIGKASATPMEIEEAAKVANAYDFIEALPEKFQTNIGDMGGKLSGGQKQRLSIARAVLKNPPIMILDEATSALDTESEKLVQNALEKMMMNRTSLVIAHRLSTIQKADIIVVMEKGKIIEQGNHATLMAQNGTYRKLVEMQSFQ
ncbi:MULTISPECIES: ABC transporter ATP-binding protein [Capnocytophaga]|jgi:ABC transporter, ATP-binding protein, msbA family|uniref:ABC transporter ATP-binding protein n=1 Tax=Capnocytophaga TaxID=1016 RepID=UPI00027C6A08|nr:MULTISPECIES: ABC transporter ATP-binding protein [Capnocytophaga]EJU31380.1 ABC transporter transmembrane region [Capnocytophaga sp. CM59]RKW10875.1 MAG: ABC transporter ATP-binding protein [Capnocytophaga sp.]